MQVGTRLLTILHMSYMLFRDLQEVVMQVSRYNWSIRKPAGLFVFNGRSGALAHVAENQEEAVVAVLESDKDTIDSAFRACPSPLQKQLLDGCFVNTLCFDERKAVAALANRLIYSTELTNMTIVPTTACNFSCAYCYAKRSVDNPEFMDGNTVQTTIDFIKRYSKSNFSIAFTGGEPLLAPEICLRFSSELKAFLEARGNVLHTVMVTNGYLLDENMLNEFQKYGLERVQITLDGPREIHNQKRHLSNGCGTFDTIVENIKNASRKIFVSVRVNLDPDHRFDLDTFEELFKGDKLHLYYAPTGYDNAGDPLKTTCSWQNYHDFVPSSKQARRVTFQPRLAGCSATALMGLGVCPNGSFIKCWEDIGLDPIPDYGNVFDGFVSAAKMAEWLNASPWDERLKCWECKLLPMCGGGCPRPRVVFKKPIKCSFPNPKEFEECLSRYVDQVLQSKCGNGSDER